MDEKNLSLILDITGHGLWDWNIVTNTVTGNDHYFKVLGLEKPQNLEIKVEAYLDLIHPEDKLAMSYALNDQYKNRTKNSDSIHRIVRPNGEIVWIHAIGRAIEWCPK